MKKHKQVAHENLERWLVSYADFITLMFAFFVVMFAASQADKGKAKRVSESVRKALEEGQIASAIAGILGGTPGDKGKGNAALKGPGGVNSKPTSPEAEPQYLTELMPSLQYLTAELKQEIATGKMQVRLESRGLVVSLTEAAFFSSGDHVISPAAFQSIEKVSVAIKRLPNPVRLEGHTDAVPIHNSRFRSNWDLSAARGVSMLELLSHRFGVPAERLAIAGYADNKPLGPNDTEDGRARNRRVDIVILNKLGYELEMGEPEKESKGGEAPHGVKPAKSGH